MAAARNRNINASFADPSSPHEALISPNSNAYDVKVSSRKTRMSSPFFFLMLAVLLVGIVTYGQLMEASTKIPDVQKIDVDELGTHVSKVVGTQINALRQELAGHVATATADAVRKELSTMSVKQPAETKPNEYFNPIYTKGGEPPVCRLIPVEEGGPVPVALVTMGRSGSSSIWQVMGTLTGEETPSVEYTGSDAKQSRNFFDTVVRENDNGNWALKYMCQKQIKYPDAGVVGFKWKPFKDTFLSEKSLAALRMIAGSHNPQIKIVRSKRNGLDRTLSVYKHRNNHAPAHCKVGDQACIEAHIKAAQGLKVPVEDMMMRLEQEYEAEIMVDRVLQELGVPHVYVSFDELFHGDNIAKEWARIFAFLGVGPKEDSLTTEMVEKAMMHAATHSPYHNETIENYEEVRDALMGTKFENLLH